MDSPFTVRLFDWPEARRFARPVRERVFVEEQNVPRELEWDDRDASALHAVAFDERERAIGTARLLNDGHIGRMAVLPEWRRRGVGRALASELIRRARTNGLAEVVLNAQLQAEPFYRSLGFAPRGPVFEEAGIPHREMALRLRRDPAES